MALIIPVGFGQAVYELALTGDAEPVVTTMGHDLSNVVGGDYEEIANRLFDGFGQEMMGAISDQYSLTGVSLYVGQDGGPPAVFFGTDTAVVGGDAGLPLPQNCAALVRKRTGAAGRRGRGRMYLPGVRENVVNAIGVMDSTYVTAWQTSIDGWFDLLNGVPAGSVAYPPVILHRSEGIGEEPPPTPVTALVLDDVIATQRRRLRK